MNHHQLPIPQCNISINNYLLMVQHLHPFWILNINHPRKCNFEVRTQHTHNRIGDRNQQFMVQQLNNNLIRLRIFWFRSRRSKLFAHVTRTVLHSHFYNKFKNDTDCSLWSHDFWTRCRLENIIVVFCLVTPSCKLLWSVCLREMLLTLAWHNDLTVEWNVYCCLILVCLEQINIITCAHTN